MNVSVAPPYFDDVRFGIGEGPVEVWSIISVVLLQIFAFNVLIRGSSWLVFDVAISTSSFGMFYSKVPHLQHVVLTVKDCKPASFEGFLQLMFFQCVLDLVVSNEWLFGLYSIFWRGYLRVSFFFVVFIVQSLNSDRKWTFEGRRRLIWFLMYFYFLEVVLYFIIHLLYRSLFSLRYIRRDVV